MGSHHRLAAAGLSLALLAGLDGAAGAGQADVLKAEIHRQPDGAYRIDATLRHADSGWDHYANRWEVIGPAGQVIATRTAKVPSDLHP